MILRVVPNSVYEQLIQTGLLDKNGKGESGESKKLSEVLQHIPETLRSKGQELLDFLIKTGVSWNSSGCVYYNNNEIPDSNIRQLIENIVFGRESYWNLPGSEEIRNLVIAQGPRGNSIILPPRGTNQGSNSEIVKRESNPQKSEPRKSNEEKKENAVEEDAPTRWIPFKKKYTLKR